MCAVRPNPAQRRMRYLCVAQRFLFTNSSGRGGARQGEKLQLIFACLADGFTLLTQQKRVFVRSAALSPYHKYVFVRSAAFLPYYKCVCWCVAQHFFLTISAVRVRWFLQPGWA
jgi:hypothetical protein